MKKLLLTITIGASLLFGAYNSAGTDYDKAVTNSYFEETSLRSLDTVNMILSFVNQTRAEKFINKGTYKALLKEESKSGESKKAGQSSTKTEKLSEMTVNVERNASVDNAPMVVKFWMDEDDGPGNTKMRIRGHITVTNGVSAEYPYGKFTMHFGGWGVQSNGDINSSFKVMGGVLDIDKGTHEGEAVIKFDNNMTNGQGGTEQEMLELTLNVSAVDKNTDGDTTDAGEAKGYGKGFTKGMEWSGQSPALKAYKLALGNRYYLVQEVNASNPSQNVGSVTTKDKENEIYKIFRYGLYHDANGSKVLRSSGFPVVKGSGASAMRGYVGYWGIWSDNDSIGHGDTVTREDSTNGTYTAVVGTGKLKKYTKSTATMESIKGTKLYFWNENDYQQYVLSWDSTQEDYEILGTQNNYGEADASGLPGGITAGDYLFADDHNGSGVGKLKINDWTGAWSEALNANIPVKAGTANTDTISFHKESVYTPDSNLTLVNFGWEVINPSFDKNDINNTASIRADQNSSIIGGVYLYNAANMGLIDVNRSNTAIVIPADANFTGTNKEWWQWGSSMGPFVTQDRASSYNNSNFWQIEQNENVYYRWETGQQNWNKFTGVKDANGTIVKFDAPLTISHVHTAAKDANGATNNGGTYSLNYDGDSVHTPWRYDETTGQWIPKINIKSGTQVSDGSNDYRLKILDQGIFAGTGTDTEGLVIDSNLTTSYSGPDHNDTLVTGIGDKPRDANVTVIKGECVYTDCAMQ